MIEDLVVGGAIALAAGGVATLALAKPVLFIYSVVAETVTYMKKS